MRSEPAEQIVELELRLCVEDGPASPRGHTRDRSGRQHSFHGWLGLLGVLESLCDPKSPTPPDIHPCLTMSIHYPEGKCNMSDEKRTELEAKQPSEDEPEVQAAVERRNEDQAMNIEVEGHVVRYQPEAFRY